MADSLDVDYVTPCRALFHYFGDVADTGITIQRSALYAAYAAAHRGGPLLTMVERFADLPARARLGFLVLTWPVSGIDTAAAGINQLNGIELHNSATDLLSISKNAGAISDFWLELRAIHSMLR